MFCAGIVSGTAMAQSNLPPPPPKSKVYYAIDGSALSEGNRANPRTVQRMVDSLICNLAQKPTVAQAWAKYVTPSDVVGIKVSASGQATSGTHPEVVDAIARGLIESGVPARNIIVWDRNIEDLLAAGFRKDNPLYILQGIDPQNGYDQDAQVSAPVLGKLIWGDSQFGKREGSRISDRLSNGDQLSSRSFFAKVLSKSVTKVINVPSMTDSFMTGINGGVVNMTVFNLDNWRRFGQASMDGGSYLSEVYADELVKDKVALTMMDALVIQYAGGPMPNPNFAVNNFTIFASTDVIAIDATAVRLIDELRKGSKLPSIKPACAWIESGAQLGLGQFSETRTELLRVGVEALR